MENNKPAQLVLYVEPTKDFELEGFFVEEGNPLFELIKNPGYLRHMGWNMTTLDHPKIIDGKCWEVNNGDRKMLRLFQDGTMLAIGNADETFLGWGRDHDSFMKAPQLNSLAIIEYVFEFVDLYKRIFALFPAFGNLRFGIGIQNLKNWDGKRLFLNPTEVLDHFYTQSGPRSPYIYLENDFYDEITVGVQGETFDSKKVSFKLLAKLFPHFGIPEDKIPYIKLDETGVRSVDTEKILSNR